MHQWTQQQMSLSSVCLQVVGEKRPKGKKKYRSPCNDSFYKCHRKQIGDDDREWQQDGLRLAWQIKNTTTTLVIFLRSPLSLLNSDFSLPAPGPLLWELAEATTKGGLANVWEERDRNWCRDASMVYHPQGPSRMDWNSIHPISNALREQCLPASWEREGRDWSAERGAGAPAEQSWSLSWWKCQCIKKY